MVAEATESKTVKLHELNEIDVIEILRENGYGVDPAEFKDCRFLEYNKNSGQAIYSFTFPSPYDGSDDPNGRVYVWAEWDELDKGKIKADF